MNKPLCVISCPVDVYSGYSGRSRDLVKSIIELKKDEWEIKIVPQRWGDCSWGFIEDHKEEWGFLQEYILNYPNLPKQPDVWIQHTIAPEFQPIGKYNIGITAAVETTIAPPEWIQGCNQMNVTWVSSKHGKQILEQSKFEQKNQQGQTVGIIQLEKPVEVVLEGADLDIYKILPQPNFQSPVGSWGYNLDLEGTLDTIPEKFAYLFIGHWIGIGAPIGEDRKNVGLLVKAFFETFKNKSNKPALILKTSGAVSSYMDRTAILKAINEIKKTVNSENLPNIYLLHGEFTDKEINKLYNHPKVKAMVSLTKGEGYGRPLLEFSLIGKPIISTNWSGHTDFLTTHGSVLLGGNLTNVHPAVSNQWLIKESQWFSPNYQEIGEALTNVYKNYDKYLPAARKQAENNKEKFSYEAMKNIVGEQLKKVPEFPKQVQLVLPKLNAPSGMKPIQLPKLTKIEK